MRVKMINNLLNFQDMQDIFNTATIQEFEARIQKLDNDSVAKWGKMNAYQMVKHCALNEELMLRKKTYKRRFLGLLFGKMALKANIGSDGPLQKSSPTHPDLIIKEEGDVNEIKQWWIDLLRQYPQMRPSDYTGFVHPFFGKMTPEQISKLAYKHVDHHLTQFGV